MEQRTEMKRIRLGTEYPVSHPLSIAWAALALAFAALAYFNSNSVYTVICVALIVFDYPLISLCVSRRYYATSAGVQVTVFGRVVQEMPWDKITAAGTWTKENGCKMTFLCSAKPKQIIQYSEKHSRFVKAPTPVSLFECVPVPTDLKWTEAVSVYLALEGKKKSKTIIMLPAKEQHAQLIGQSYCEAQRLKDSTSRP